MFFGRRANAPPLPDQIAPSWEAARHLIYLPRHGHRSRYAVTSKAAAYAAT
jgi:hypothetical protein